MLEGKNTYLQKRDEKAQNKKVSKSEKAFDKKRKRKERNSLLKESDIIAHQLLLKQQEKEEAEKIDEEVQLNKKLKKGKISRQQYNQQLEKLDESTLEPDYFDDLSIQNKTRNRKKSSKKFP